MMRLITVNVPDGEYGTAITTGDGVDVYSVEDIWIVYQCRQ